MRYLFKLWVFLALFCFTAVALNAQDENVAQNIRGKLVDQDTKTPLIGATVELLSMPETKPTVTDDNGEFVFKNIPVGRHTLRFRYLGYRENTINNVLLNSGKELYLNVELEESVTQLDEIIVKAYTDKEKPVNEMALVGARSFTVEETERFAGSMGDVARLVANYAGVTNQDDSRNDIIIRGNSPMGLLWRLDGVEIPNPNHFGQLGTTGGPISMLNNNQLTNSDFYTGAFPAEFSNALAGAFDLRMRTPNNQQREYMAQVGLNGFEAGLEGPFVKGKRASYMANYRYSTLALMHDIGLSTGTGDAVPNYQDLSFKIEVPTRSMGKFSVFGIMGKSNILFEPKREIETDENSVFSDDDERTNYQTAMLTSGVTHQYHFNSKTSLRTTLSGQYSQSAVEIDRYQFYWNYDSTADSHSLKSSFRFPFIDNKYEETRYTLASHVKHKPNAKNIFQSGFYIDYYDLYYSEIVDTVEYESNDSTHIPALFQTLDQDGAFPLIRAYTQWLHKFTDDLSANIGLNYMHLTYNGSKILEPRAAISWKFNPAQTISFGYGWHSQLPPRMLYFVESTDDQTGEPVKNTNKNLDFLYSQHYVLGYDLLPAKNWRIKTETYFQDLSNIPVQSKPSNFSVINEGMNFFISLADSLVNEGTGTNYGVEFTLEKFLSQNYYMLLTASVFESKFTASNGLQHNTIFNSNFVTNALAGYEIKIGNNNRITIDGKAIWGGGKRYTPVYENWQEREEQDETIYNYDKVYSLQAPDYFRIDLRFGFKQNLKNIAQEWAIELGNITQRKNVFNVYFDTETSQYEYVYHDNAFPFMALYRIYF